MAKSKISWIPIVVSVIVSLAIVVPLSFASNYATVSIFDNIVHLEESYGGNVNVSAGDAVPYETEDGDQGIKLVHDENDENFISVTNNKEVTIEVTVDDSYFCLYVYKPKLYPNPNNSSNYRQATLEVTFEGTDYRIENTTLEEVYYSIHNTDPNDNTLLVPVEDIDDVIFMTFEDTIVMKMTATRDKIGGNETVLMVHMICR